MTRTKFLDLDRAFPIMRVLRGICEVHLCATQSSARQRGKLTTGILTVAVRVVKVKIAGSMSKQAAAASGDGGRAAAIFLHVPALFRAAPRGAAALAAAGRDRPSCLAAARRHPAGPCWPAAAAAVQVRVWNAECANHNETHIIHVWRWKIRPAKSGPIFCSANRSGSPVLCQMGSLSNPLIKVFDD